MAEHTPAEAPDQAERSYTAELIVNWSIVGIPLTYGLYNALKAAAQLFSG